MCTGRPCASCARRSSTTTRTSPFTPSPIRGASCAASCGGSRAWRAARRRIRDRGSMHTRASFGAGCLLLTLGCTRGEHPAPAGATQTAPGLARPAALGGATVMVVVKFVGTPPASPAIDMTEEPKCKAVYRTAPHTPVVVVDPNGTLADVFVYVKAGLPADAKYAAPTTPVTIDQKGCMYHPPVF